MPNSNSITEQEVVEIAARLTKAQRAAVLAMPINSIGCGIPSSTLALLCVGHAGLVSGKSLPPLCWKEHLTLYNKRYYLNQLGLAVRDHLLSAHTVSAKEGRKP